MAEHTFYNPSAGVWVAVDDVPENMLAAYPPGTVEIAPYPGTGFTFNGSKWVYAEPPAVATVLRPLTRRQLRRGLLTLGLKPIDVEAKIAELPEDQREIALIDWQDASEYERSHPLVSMLGASFGLSSEKIDEAWLAAQEL